MDLYPVHLKFDGRAALVVGGGSVAVMKTAALVHGGARVRVVASRLSEAMMELIRECSLAWEQRAFVPADVEGAWLVVGATGDPAVSRQIAESARRRNVLVYIVDDPLQSDLIVPAVLRRGKLVVTVSSSGLAPAFASRVRDYLSGILGESFGEVLERLPAVRERLKERYPDPARRRAAWYRYLDERVLPRLKERGDHIRKHRGAREES